jgi:heme exporter protein B
MTAAFLALIGRDLRLSVRQGADALLVLAFFVLAVLLFPFGVGPSPDILARIATGIVWATALLAALLSLDRLFLADYEDGSLDQIALSPLPLELAIVAKSAAHWLAAGLPLTLFSPVLGLMLHLPADGMAALVASLLLGTPVMSLIGGIGAALTLGARRGAALLPLLVLPLYIPVLIFGVAAVEAASQGLDVLPRLGFLAGFLLAALALGPWAAAAALRQALE